MHIHPVRRDPRISAHRVSFEPMNSKTLPTTVAILALSALLLAGCADSSSDDRRALRVVTGTVVGAEGRGVGGAVVYLVPTDAVDRTPITAEGVLDRTAEAFDEPLEDAVQNRGASLPQDVTKPNGRFRIEGAASGVDPDLDYYIFVVPSAGEYLPGGDLCRVSRPGSSLLGADFRIELSSSPTAAAQFVGSSTCLECHADHAGIVYTAHKNGLTALDRLGDLQDPSNFEGFFDSLDRFPEAADYTGGRVLTFGDIDATRVTDVFEVYEGTSPPQIDAPAVTGYLWRDAATAEYKITLENLLTREDPMSPLTLPVRLAYGGTVYKQNFLVEFPGRLGHYVFLQFQAYPGISTGSDEHFDRTRATWRDYGLAEIFDLTTQLFRAPSPTATFEANCAACHFTGYEAYESLETRELLARAVADPRGTFDIDRDGQLDEINIGCESCHGAGSEHVAWNTTRSSSRYILDIAALSPSREVTICARCHDNVVGQGTLANQQPLDADDRFPAAGIRRARFLTDHTRRPGPDLEDYWPDRAHSKSHHQQAADFVKSSKYRNDRQLLACSDCHDPHADRSLAKLPEYPHNLLGDPADPAGILCARCHAIDPVPHMIERSASAHAGPQTECASCHMPRTAQAGAGQYGTLLAPPTGSDSDVDTVYWMNDISSHLFRFVYKYDLGVAGVPPATAMPAPYTNRCGTCHDPSNLPRVEPERD